MGLEATGLVTMIAADPTPFGAGIDQAAARLRQFKAAVDSTTMTPRFNFSGMASQFVGSLHGLSGGNIVGTFANIATLIPGWGQLAAGIASGAAALTGFV